MEQMHIVYSSGNQGKLTLLLNSGEGSCQPLAKNLCWEMMAKEVAEHQPLSYEQPELRNDVCSNCTKRCNRFRQCSELTDQELNKFTELVYHYQEGDSPLVEEIREQLANEY